MRFLTLLSLLFFSLQSMATMQSPDRLLYKGELIRLEAFPLNQCPQIEDIYKVIRTKDWTRHTGCWRGYIAHWEVENDNLYLTKIVGCGTADTVGIDLHAIFGTTDKKGRVKAQWVNEQLYSTSGEMIYLGQGGDEVYYEKQLDLDVKKGKVVNAKFYENTLSRKSEIAHPSAFAKYFYTKVDWSKFPLSDTNKAGIFFSFSANSKGKIDSIEFGKNSDKIYQDEIIRVLNTIPQWAIIYSKNKHVRLPWRFRAHFNEANRNKFK